MAKSKNHTNHNQSEYLHQPASKYKNPSLFYAYFNSFYVGVMLLSLFKFECKAVPYMHPDPKIINIVFFSRPQSSQKWHHQAEKVQTWVYPWCKFCNVISCPVIYFPKTHFVKILVWWDPLKNTLVILECVPRLRYDSKPGNRIAMIIS